MTAVVLADELGPRGRRTVTAASVVAGVALAGVVAYGIIRLDQRNQLDGALWEPFTQSSVVRFLLGGLFNTIKAASMAMGLAMVVGALFALGRLARTPALRWAAGAYVEFFRAVPLILLIMFAGFGLPKYGVDWPSIAFLVLALVLYNSAILAEIFRAGILSLDRGQTEAALSIGMTYWQSMLLVIVPQAARRMVPAIVSQLVTLLKDTALGYVIIFEELLRRGRITGEFFHNPLQSLVIVAGIYMTVNLVLSRIARRLEVRQRRRYRAGGIAVAGIEELTGAEPAAAT